MSAGPEIPSDVTEFMVASTSDYIRQILSEPSLINALVEPRVQQLIAAGDLVPRSRLQLGVGLELGPVGLEQAALALVAAVGEIKMPEVADLTEALAALVAVLERVDAPAIPEPSAPVDASDQADVEEPAVEESRCEICNVVITDDQKLASKTRWRKELCSDHHASYDPKKPLAPYDGTKEAKRKKAS